MLGRAPGAGRGLPGQHRLPGPGRTALPATVGRGPSGCWAPISTGHWDATGARDRLARLGIPLDRPVAKLSGGQRAQVGLGLALAKRPAGPAPRRAGGRPRPAGPTGVPGVADRGRGRRGPVGDPLVPPAARPRAGVRPRHPVGRVAHPAVRRDRRRAGLAPDAGGPTAAAVAGRAIGPRDQDHPDRPTRPGCWPVWTVRCSTRPGRSSEVGLEDIILAYMGHDDPGRRPSVLDGDGRRSR